ncbi:MAG: hypothetical protein WBB45_07200 [Cyclobacteriaceae bacterium]
MFGLFKKKKSSKGKLPELCDIHGEPLTEGDEVMAHRYELGRAELILEKNSYQYRSLESGKTVGFHLMIDASTQRQKVEKIQAN